MFELLRKILPRAKKEYSAMLYMGTKTSGQIHSLRHLTTNDANPLALIIKDILQQDGPLPFYAEVQINPHDWNAAKIENLLPRTPGATRTGRIYFGKLGAPEMNGPFGPLHCCKTAEGHELPVLTTDVVVEASPDRKTYKVTYNRGETLKP